MKSEIQSLQSESSDLRKRIAALEEEKKQIETAALSTYDQFLIIQEELKREKEYSKSLEMESSSLEATDEASQSPVSTSTVTDDRHEENPPSSDLDFLISQLRAENMQLNQDISEANDLINALEAELDKQQEFSVPLFPGPFSGVL